jgi:hypothetical protein
VDSHVYQAVSDVQAAIAPRGIAKSRKNSQGAGYNFRGIDDILNALGPLMPQHSLTVFPRMVERDIAERQSKNGGVLFFVSVKAEFDFVSTKDGSTKTVTTFGEAMDSSDKATNKAMSVAWKYAAILTFQIPVEGENDADATTHQLKPAKQIEAPFPNGPARNASQLKAMWREYWAEIESCEDADQLDALLAVEANRKLTRQLKEALPDWWNGGTAKGEAYEGAGERLAKKQAELTERANGIERGEVLQ